MGASRDLIEFVKLAVKEEKLDQGGLLQALEALRDKKADFSFVLDGQTCASIAVEANSIPILQKIIDLGNVNVNQVFGEKELSLITIAAKSENVSEEMLRFLIEKGASVESENCENSPLILAAEAGNVSKMRILLENGAQISQREKNAVKIAVMQENFEAVKVLIKFGVRLEEISDKYQDSEWLQKMNREFRVWEICCSENWSSSDFRFLKKSCTKGVEIDEILECLPSKIQNMKLSQMAAYDLVTMQILAYFNKENIVERLKDYLTNPLTAEHVIFGLFASLVEIKRQEEIEKPSRALENDCLLIQSLLKKTGVIPESFDYSTKNGAGNENETLREIKSYFVMMKRPFDRAHAALQLVSRFVLAGENLQGLKKKAETLEEREELISQLQELLLINYSASCSIRSTCNILIDEIKKMPEIITEKRSGRGF